MLTVIETPEFTTQAKGFWNDDERSAFIDWIAANPEAGDVIPGAGGARKVRWAALGKGKRGGARVIYFNLSAQGALLLIAIYVKAERSNLPAGDIRKAVHRGS